MGAHFGDNANSSNAVLRYANVNNEPSNANTNIGSSLRERAKKFSLGKREFALRLDRCFEHWSSSFPNCRDPTSMVKNDRQDNDTEVVRILVAMRL